MYLFRADKVPIYFFTQFPHGFCASEGRLLENEAAGLSDRIIYFVFVARYVTGVDIS
jgi:hypothetical protein